MKVSENPIHFIEGKSEIHPQVFIQWKGTDACFDFWCECGAALHHDGYFAYFVQCGVCETTWEMPCHLFPRKAHADQEPTVRLEPDEEY